MRITELFGIKFARRYKYKAQIIANFKQWKRERMYFLAEDRNKKKLFGRLLKKYIQEHPKSYRSIENIASELWEDLNAEVAKTSWQQIFDKILGSDVESPYDQLRSLISRKDTKELFRDYNCKHYYFTDTAVQECEKVHITEMDMEWLMDAEDGKRQLNWGNQFIRYEKKGNKIVAVAASFTQRQESKYLEHTFFVFDLNTPKVQYDAMADIVEEQCEKDLEYNPNGFDNRMKLLLYKMITFLDLIPLKQITLPKWGALEADASSSKLVSRGNQIDPVYNNDNLPITVVTVNANWNCTIYIEETTVTGYFKNMPCGKGRTKLIKRFVKPHRRSAHERIAGKLKAVSTTYGSTPKT